LTSYAEFFLSQYPAFSPFYIYWGMGLCTGLRVQNAYKSRNTDDEEETDFDAFEIYEKEILDNVMPLAWVRENKKKEQERLEEKEAEKEMIDLNKTIIPPPRRGFDV